MIYMDVTGACLLPLQSGIPRTTRGLYRLLGNQLPDKILPVFWQPFRCRYTGLSERARLLLQNPFPRKTNSARVPRDSTLPLLLAAFTDLLGCWPDIIPLRKILKSDDIVLLTSIFPDNRLEYLKQLESSPGRKIAVFHDAIPLKDPLLQQWEKKRNIQTLKLLAQMDVIIAVSKTSEMDLHKLWDDYGVEVRASTVALPWPVALDGNRPEFSPPPRDKKKVLYVSRLKQVKNHGNLFSACRELWNQGIDFELDLIGCEDEARESRTILRTVKQLQHENRPVSWRAQVTEEELHKSYQSATFTVFPSLAEGFGLPIIESFWHGRAVICSGCDATGELTRNGGVLTCDVRNAGQIAQAMKSLLQDPAKCLALSREAYERPQRTWADYWKELQPVLQPK